MRFLVKDETNDINDGEDLDVADYLSIRDITKMTPVETQKGSGVVVRFGNKCGKLFRPNEMSTLSPRTLP